MRLGKALGAGGSVSKGVKTSKYIGDRIAKRPMLLLVGVILYAVVDTLFSLLRP